MNIARFLTILGVLGLASLYTDRAALALNCHNEAKRPNIVIRPSSDEVVFKNNKSEKELSEFDIDTISPYSQYIDTEVGGLMSGEIQVQSRMRLAVKTNRTTGQLCVWYDTIEVAVRLDPIVYIASEYAPGTCRYNAILEHELKHVAVDRKVVGSYLSEYKDRIDRAIRLKGVSGPFPLEDEEKVRASLGDFVQDVIGEITKEMYEDRRIQQQAIDSLEEYERVNNMCS